MAFLNVSSSWANWNPWALQLITHAATEHAANNLVERAQRNLAAGGHDDTGRLSNSFVVEVHHWGYLGARASVTNTAEYAGWVDQGTGHNGGGRIGPTTASVLRFKPGKRSGGGFVDYLYRPSVSGQKATYFWTNAVRDTTLRDFIF